MAATQPDLRREIFDQRGLAQAPLVVILHPSRQQRTNPAGVWQNAGNESPQSYVPAPWRCCGSIGATAGHHSFRRLRNQFDRSGLALRLLGFRFATRNRSAKDALLGIANGNSALSGLVRNRLSFWRSHRNAMDCRQ